MVALLLAHQLWPTYGDIRTEQHREDDGLSGFAGRVPPGAAPLPLATGKHRANNVNNVSTGKGLYYRNTQVLAHQLGCHC